jgi:uncharacterized repeat protein (TIGR04076 family)
MTSYDIECKVIKVIDETVYCCRRSDNFIFGEKNPKGMCARAFAAIYPTVAAMQVVKMPMPQNGKYIDRTCPSRNVVYRLEYCPVKADQQ